MELSIIVSLSSPLVQMIYHVCLLLVLAFCASSALQISSTSPYYKEGELEGHRSAEAYSLLLTEFSNRTDVFTSGFVRTDIYDSSNQWIRAQVLPIGVCFKEGGRGGTAVTLQVMMTSSHILRVTNIYAGSDCNGGYQTVLLKAPIVKTVSGYENKIKHSADIKAALSIPSHFTDGIIVSTYYSSEGCTGAVAQYDIVFSDKLIGYDAPIGTCGVFLCESEAEMVALYTHSYCNENYNTDKMGYRIMKQPFRCTNVSVADLNGKGFPVYQTVRCVERIDASVLSDDVADKAEFSQFFGTDANADAGTGVDDDGGYNDDDDASSTADDDEWYWKK